MNIFEHNAAELERLREQVNDAFERRNQGPSKMAVWKEAALAFHAAYDKLAFPGGLSKEFQLLQIGDPDAIEMAVRYLEANPWYFRSGYYKVDLLKLLGKHPLSDQQRSRLRTVILERVRGRPVREMRAYGRLAPKVATIEFEAELKAIAENSNRHAARHAKLILEYLGKPGLK